MKYIKYIIGTITIPVVGIIAFFTQRPDEQKLKLAFDLDSTIIHSVKAKNIDCMNNNLLKKPDFILDNPDPKNKYLVWRRPYSKFVLKFLSKFNSLYLFTASTQNYADPIVYNLFPTIDFKQRLYRESCEDGKNLTKISEKNIVLIDDNIKNNKNNSFYHIYPYNFLSKHDRELIKLVGFVIIANLIGLSNVKNLSLFKKTFIK